MSSTSTPPAGWPRTRWAVAAVVGLTAGYVLWTRLAIGGTAVTVAFSDIFIGLINFAAGLTCLAAGRRVPGRRGWGWGLIGTGMLAWAFGEVVWTWYEVVLGVEVPFPSLADVGFLAMVPLVLAGMAGMLDFRGGALRTVLDGLLVAGSLLFVLWPTVLEPTYQAGGQDLLTRSIALAYPIGDLAVASMVFILLSQTGRRARAPLALAATGMLAVAGADVGFAALTLHGSYLSGSVVDPGWVVGFLLVALAGLRAPAAAGQPDRPGRTPPMLVVLPYVPLAAALVTSVSVQLVRGSVGSFLYVLFTVLVILVVLRQLATLRENLRLTRQLGATVEDLRHREEQLRHLAFHDPLTGLANRALFQQETDRVVERRRQDPAPLGIIYIDLDGFKQVNDSLGHPVGDALLVAVAERLRACTRAGDTVARLGGDEFAMLLDGCAEADAGRLAERIVTVLSAPFELDGHEVRVSASIGVAVQPAGADQASELLRDADIAMYAAKLAGKARFIPFEPQLRDRIASADRQPAAGPAR